MKPITRRVGMRALLAAFLLPTRGTASAAAVGKAQAALRSLFSDLPSARAIGAAYIGKNPADRIDPAILPTCLTATDLRSTIAARVRDDFSNSRVVSVDGWMLAVTEARLCALAYLTG